MVGITGEERLQCFPFMFFEKDRTGYIWSFAAEFDEMIDAPGDNHIDRQAGFDRGGVAELSLFDLAAALESLVIDLNTPTLRVPIQFFGCVGEGVYSACCQQ